MCRPSFFMSVVYISSLCLKRDNLDNLTHCIPQSTMAFTCACKYLDKQYNALLFFVFFFKGRRLLLLGEKGDQNKMMLTLITLQDLYVLCITKEM